MGHRQSKVPHVRIGPDKTENVGSTGVHSAPFVLLQWGQGQNERFHVVTNFIQDVLTDGKGPVQGTQHVQCVVNPLICQFTGVDLSLNV